MASKLPPEPPLPDHLAQLRVMLEDTLRHPAFVDLFGFAPVPSGEEMSLSDLAGRRIRQGRDRARFFGRDAELFANPAWQILLLLFVSRGKEPVSVSAACHASGVPYTTGLRWIERLEERGLIARSKHPTDRRSWFLDLTARGLSTVNAVLGRELTAGGTA